MASHIHPSAIIEAGAEIGDDCRIGPHCLIGRNVVLGANNVLLSHVVIGGHTTVADGNEIHPFACLGTEPRTLLRRNIPLRDAIAQLQSEFAGQSDVATMISFAATSVLGLARSRMMGKNPNE
jgi:acyl-[acyl carrier protein]--UDP-N-acetylglucosamine O-acyltransferase